jgi:DNA polymerase I-like protein with 3'-5' exonuclease and polymerase domains
MWCAVTKDLDTGEVTRFIPKDLDKLVDHLDKAELLVCHNLIGYDRKVIKHLFNYEIPFNKIRDTLVMSRLADAKRPAHSIEYWGNIFGRAKPEHEDWTQFSQEMLHRCEEDVEINALVYNRLLKDLKHFSKLSINLEHHHQLIMEQQKENGFYVNSRKAHRLYNNTRRLADDLELKLKQRFPDVEELDETVEVLRKKPTKEQEKLGQQGDIYARVVNKVTKYAEERDLDVNELLKQDKVDIYKRVPFNPDSPKQIVEKLLSIGWEPTEFTPAGQPKFPKDTIALESSKIPEIKDIGLYSMLRSRQNVAKQWLDLADHNGYVHGTCWHIGTWTHRSSHSDPNLGNIPRVNFGKDGPITGIEGSFGFECRDCWTVEDTDKNTLVGVDVSGIQLRALAHYMQDQEYVNQILDGDIHTYKEPGTTRLVPL